jgi:hypothetical protein
MTIAEIRLAILSATLTADDIAELQRALIIKRDDLAAHNKHAFNVGQNVRAANSQTSIDGVIVKINRKKAIVRTSNGDYQVPFNMLMAA